MEPNYTLEDLTPKEMQDLTDEMQAVLSKYNCEMGVRSTIEILKRVPTASTEEATPNDGTEPEQIKEETA